MRSRWCAPLGMEMDHTLAAESLKATPPADQGSKKPLLNPMFDAPAVPPNCIAIQSARGVVPLYLGKMT